MLNRVRKNDALRGRYLVAPRIELPMEELIEAMLGRCRPSPGNALGPEEYEREVDAGLCRGGASRGYNAGRPTMRPTTVAFDE